MDLVDGVVGPDDRISNAHVEVLRKISHNRRIVEHNVTACACGNVVFHNAAVMRYLPQNLHVRVGDTVVWADDTLNEIHAVTFLAGQSLPQIPDWYFTDPTGGTSYDGSTYYNSGALYPADAGRNHSLTLTF